MMRFLSTCAGEGAFPGGMAGVQRGGSGDKKAYNSMRIFKLSRSGGPKSFYFLTHFKIFEVVGDRGRILENFEKIRREQMHKNSI